MATINSLAKFNAELRKAGFDVELVKGRGYFYFVGAELPSIYTNAFNHCPPAIWALELESAITALKSD